MDEYLQGIMTYLNPDIWTDQRALLKIYSIFLGIGNYLAAYYVLSLPVSISGRETQTPPVAWHSQKAIINK